MVFTKKSVGTIIIVFWDAIRGLITMWIVNFRTTCGNPTKWSPGSTNSSLNTTKNTRGTKGGECDSESDEEN